MTTATMASAHAAGGIAAAGPIDRPDGADAIEVRDGDLALRVRTSLHGLDAAPRDAIADPDEAFQRHDYRLALEEGGVDGCRFAVLEVSRGGEIVAHAAGYTCRYDLNVDGAPAVDRLLRPVRRRWPGAFYGRLLQIGNPTNMGRPIAISNCVPQSVRRRSVALLHEGALALAAERGTGLVTWRDFYGDEAPQGEVLEAFGCRKVAWLPNVFVETAHRSFDRWLRALRSHYRYKVRRRMARLDAAGLAVERVTGDDLVALSDALARLWSATHARAREYRWERVGAPFFRAVARRLGPRASAHVVRDGERLLGFALMIDGRETSKFQYTGLDYEANERLPIYHNLLIAVVRHGIEGGFRRVDLGISTYGPKLALGGSLAPSTTYVGHGSAIVRPFLPIIAKAMTRRAPPIERNAMRHPID